MEYRTLGRTGIPVSRLAFGGLFVASFAAELDAAKAAVHQALELGFNYIDTAPTYGNSEEVLGKALAGVTKPLVISTKLGGRPQPFLPKDPACLLASVEESLRLLGRKHIGKLRKRPAVSFGISSHQRGIMIFPGFWGTWPSPLAKK